MPARAIAASWFLALGACVFGGSPVAAAPAVPPLVAPASLEPRGGIELRIGAQGTGGRLWPAVGALVSISLPRRLDLIIGYELVRVWDVALPTSSDTAEGPIVLSAIRAGFARRFPTGGGWFTRLGAIGGLATPSLSVASAPASSMEGIVGELTIDLAGGYRGRIGYMAMFLAPTASWGEVGSRWETASGRVSAAEQIRAVSFALGLSIGPHF